MVVLLRFLGEISSASEASYNATFKCRRAFLFFRLHLNLLQSMGSSGELMGTQELLFLVFLLFLSLSLSLSLSLTPKRCMKVPLNRSTLLFTFLLFIVCFTTYSHCTVHWWKTSMHQLALPRCHGVTLLKELTRQQQTGNGLLCSKPFSLFVFLLLNPN